MEKKVLVFAPHPDDETLGCGGTILKRLSEGCGVYVVFMTDGRHGLAELGVDAGPAPSELRKVRREEAMRATEVLGVQNERVFFLDVEDKALRNQRRHAMGRVAKTLQSISPVEVYYPQDLEYHIDHRATNSIVKSAMTRLGHHPIEYLYAIDWAYPFNVLARVCPEQGFDILMSKVLRLHLKRICVSSYLPLKRAALEKYRSQIEVVSRGQKKPALGKSFLNRFLREEEKFFVRPETLT